MKKLSQQELEFRSHRVRLRLTIIKRMDEALHSLDVTKGNKRRDDLLKKICAEASYMMGLCNWMR